MRGQMRTGLALSLLGLAVMTWMGCGGQETPAPSTPESNTTTSSNQGVTIPSDVATAPTQAQSGPNPADTPATAADIAAIANIQPLLKYDSQRPLVGSWLGVAYMDPETLKQRLEKAEGAEREELTLKARTFLSFQIAMDLYSDGRMGGVIQGYINGQEDLKEITGTWQIVEQTAVADGFRFVVETTEANPEGEALKNQIVMTVSPDHQQMSRPYESDPRLMVCEPQFVFDRIPENYAQQVAEQQQNTQLK